DIYQVGETVSLKDTQIYDANGISDLSRLDFWLLREGGNWENIGDAYSFTQPSWSTGSNSNWASFNQSLSGLGAGNYTLYAFAYDQSQAISNSHQTSFKINGSPEIQFKFTKNTYTSSEIVRVVDDVARVFDPNGANDIAEVKFWLKTNNGDWQYISSQYGFNPSAEDSRWASFPLNFSGSGVGNYTLQAIAYDQSGAASHPLIREFQVTAAAANNDVQTPIENWQNQNTLPNIPANHWNASFINRNAGNVADYSSYDFSRPAATADLGLQGSGDGRIQLYRNFGQGSPASGVQSDYYAMLAWTPTNLQAGKLYKVTTKSDDGSYFLLKNTQTGEWRSIVNGQDGGDFRDRSATEPAKTIFFKVPQSSDYDFHAEYYEKTGDSVIDTTLEEAKPFQDSVNESREWTSSFFWWDRNQNNKPPVNFHENRSNIIGTVNLGSNRRSDGKQGINFDWGTAAPRNDVRLPDNNFAIRAYTWADFDGSPYKFRVKGDDGFQILAKNQSTDQWYYITPQNQWTQAYDSPTEITYTLPAGRYDLHFHYFEERGNAHFDLSWEEVTSGSPSGSGNPGNFPVPFLQDNPTQKNPLRGFKDPRKGEGYVSQYPGSKYSHGDRMNFYAIDINEPGNLDRGKPVYAMRDGIVEEIIDQNPDTGRAGGKPSNMVLIKHENGYYSRYLHLQQNFNSTIKLQKAQRVTVGQKIGLVGNSGVSDGYHLHVQVDKGDWISQPFEIEGLFSFS
ncbi:MAG TPA: hypothetical protein DCE56_00545, partial [Cyanobacteria bacterium UBA8553]|nr:hypothetical protein [Cyanobacteria bacterium UBA8553]